MVQTCNRGLGRCVNELHLLLDWRPEEAERASEASSWAPLREKRSTSPHDRSSYRGAVQIQGQYLRMKRQSRSSVWTNCDWSLRRFLFCNLLRHTHLQSPLQLWRAQRHSSSGTPGRPLWKSPPLFSLLSWCVCECLLWCAASCWKTSTGTLQDTFWLHFHYPYSYW